VTLIRAFVPLKHPATARRRLQEVLTAKQRHAMYFNLARRVVTALHQVPMLHDIVLVTSSAEVETFAGHLDVRVMHQLRDEGINTSLAAAIAAFAGTTTALIVPGDLPLVSGAALSELLETARVDERGVTIVPDRRHRGTNALVCTPADAIRPRFGPNSFAEHLRTAQEHGLEVRIFESGALALDIDEPEDLEAWRGSEPSTDVLPLSVPATRLPSPDLPDR
jgi:2-phospho-L-lactate/phosphoenolpyruvate guanylyltransferase